MARLLLSFVLISALAVGFSAENAFAAKKDKKKEEAADEAPAEDPIPWLCAADVTYKWKRTPKMKMDHKGKKLPSMSDNIPTDPIEVFYRRPEERGLNADDLKERLMHRLSQVKAEAFTACGEKHENESLCILEKMKSIQASYRTLDYISRQKLIETIQRDCERSMGVCLSSAASDIACIENKSPDYIEPAPEAAEPEEKGKKKKKK